MGKQLSREQVQRRMAIREAEGYLELGMPAHALRSLRRVEQVSHDDPYSLYLKGETLRTLERFEEALEPLQRAAAEMPCDIQPWISLGWCQKRTGKLKQAIHSLEMAVDIDPAEALLHFNLACYWSLARDKTRALQYLLQALSLDPDYRRLIEEESDFDSLRGDPDFQALCEEATL